MNSKLTLALLIAALQTLSTFGQTNTLPTDPLQLVRILRSDAPRKDKADACRALAVTGDDRAVPALAELLGNDELSHMARMALEPIPGPAVDRCFREALSRLQSENLVGVIGSVGVRKDAKAVPQLARLLQAQEQPVKEAAARSLGRIGDAASIKALKKALSGSSGTFQLAVCEGLFRAADALVQKRQDREAMSIYDSVYKVKNAPHQVRTAALRGAVLVRGSDGLPLLLNAFRGNDFSQAAAAVRIAFSLPQGNVVTRALTNELAASSSPDKQMLLIACLARRGDSKALPALNELALSSRDKSVRMESIRALSQFNELPPLASFLQLVFDKDPEVARLATEGMASLQGAKIDSAVMELIASPNTPQRLKGIDLAGRRRLASAVSSLYKAAASPDAEVREAAIRKIGDIGTAGDLPALLDLMSTSKEAGDIEAAEKAIGTLCIGAANREQCVERLASRMSQVAVVQKCALLRVMSAAGGPKALDTVRGALDDPQPQVRAEAIRALGSWSTPEAAPALLDLARTANAPIDRLLALRGYFGLAKLSELSEEQRLKMCSEAARLVRQPEEKRLLLAAVGDLNSPGAVTIASPFLSDESAKEEAANATIAISERLLRRTSAAKFAPELMTPLKAAAAATSNADLSAKAGKLLEEAKTKSTQP